MLYKKLALSSAAALLAAFMHSNADAAVSQKDADSLKTSLMPLGGERAGNAEGTIPAWTGGMTSDPAYKAGGRRDHLFAGDKPLFSISAANLDQYKDKVSPGFQGLFEKYPDTFRMDIYKTTRAAAAPSWVYENTYRNAMLGETIDGPAGPMPQKVYGGIPFPIAKTGAEAMWNHLLAWRGEAYRFDFRAYLVTQDGNPVMTVDCKGCQQMSLYYDQNRTPEAFWSGSSQVYQMLRIQYAGPPIRAGEQLMTIRDMNSDRDEAWVYVTGQRRVRRLPNGCCDTPSPATAGVMSFDEVFVFNGSMKRFDWTLVGKQEMYVPYNTNQLMSGKDSDVMSSHIINPDKLRWELHRVWIVDAALKQGSRHVAPKSRYYLDEDSWFALLAERYDSNKHLWKALYQLPFAGPDIPAETSQSFGFYDLVSGTAFVNGLFNEKSSQYAIQPKFPLADFTPEAMSGEGLR